VGQVAGLTFLASVGEAFEQGQLAQIASALYGRHLASNASIVSLVIFNMYLDCLFNVLHWGPDIGNWLSLFKENQQ
jgi:hypothetical protein